MARHVGALSWTGVVRDPALRPPGIVFVVGPALPFVLLVVARLPAAGAVARALPLPLLVGFKTDRVGVELFLHRLRHEGLAPRMLTFQGANVDLWVCASAPLAAWASTRGRGGERLALANVVVRSALTAPGHLHLLDAEVPNRVIGTFPYTLGAGFLTPLAATLHVLALRALASRRADHTAPGGLPP